MGTLLSSARRAFAPTWRNIREHAFFIRFPITISLKSRFGKLLSRTLLRRIGERFFWKVFRWNYNYRSRHLRYCTRNRLLCLYNYEYIRVYSLHTTMASMYKLRLLNAFLYYVVLLIFNVLCHAIILTFQTKKFLLQVNFHFGSCLGKWKLAKVTFYFCKVLSKSNFGNCENAFSNRLPKRLSKTTFHVWHGLYIWKLEIAKYKASGEQSDE